jgi:hypothetical protein
MGKQVLVFIANGSEEIEAVTTIDGWRCVTSSIEIMHDLLFQYFDEQISMSMLFQSKPMDMILFNVADKYVSCPINHWMT